MIAEQEHEIVPAIRGWLAATSDMEIPIGLSREEARRRGRELLVAIVAEALPPDNLEVDDDLKDVLWAAIEELDAKQFGQETFEECDRLYRFLLDLRPGTDTFDERDDLLHHVARIGWRSAPGGLEALGRARASVWLHGDQEYRKHLCETAHLLPAEIEALRAQPRPSGAELRSVCERLHKLTPIRPRLVGPLASLLYSLFDRQTWQVGQLDELEFLKAVTALDASMVARQLAEWDLADSCHNLAAAGFRRCADTLDLDHVEAERLALQFEKGNFHLVSRIAPTIIQRLMIPRERIKAQITYAWSLVNLNRSEEASTILEASLREPVIQAEPTLHACAFTVLGTAYSYLKRDMEATASLSAAGSILEKFNRPQDSALLMASMGEHLLGRGKLDGAITLYSIARETYRHADQARLFTYMSVLIAEVLVILGRNEEAERELVAVLPLIEKLDLRREAIAAATLLRDALANKQADAKKVRTLRDQLLENLH